MLGGAGGRAETDLWQVVFEAKVVDLATLFIKLILPKEDDSVIGSAALVFYLHRMHDALRIHYHVNEVALPRYLELKLEGGVGAGVVVGAVWKVAGGDGVEEVGAGAEGCGGAVVRGNATRKSLEIIDLNSTVLDELIELLHTIEIN